VSGEVLIVASDATWPTQFTAVADALRPVVGHEVVAIDHVGSTAVPGLPAKDVIDVQVAVAAPVDLDRVADRLAAAGFAVAAGVQRDHAVPGLPPEPDGWRKRFAREPPGSRRTNVHVRVAGRPNARYALLFRDYLRAHPPEAASYGAFKQRAAALLGDDLEAYAGLKDPVCDLIYLPAERWAQATGWSTPGARSGAPSRA
jgi:dephospho-CoA kinase